MEKPTVTDKERNQLHDFYKKLGDSIAERDNLLNYLKYIHQGAIKKEIASKEADLVKLNEYLEF